MNNNILLTQLRQNIIFSTTLLRICCQLSQCIIFVEKKPAIDVKFINDG